MKFSLVADTLEMMEKTTKRLELTSYLEKLFRITPSDVISQVVYLLQSKLRPEFEGVELGVADKIGSIKVGMEADLVLVKGDPSKNIADTRKISHVFKQGKLIDRAAIKIE